MPADDIDYYRERVVTELRLALATERQDVAAIHEELARQYQALVEQAELRPSARNTRTLRWAQSRI